MSALSLQSFGFEGQTVRVMDQGGSPWFVAQDVCSCLEIGNHSQAVSRLDEDEKGVTISDTLGGAQEVSIISESGLYALIFKSRKPAAKRFRKWVTADVLPTLRRTGRYDLSADNDDVSLVRPDALEQTKVSLSVVREARVIFGRGLAARLWRGLPGLPEVEAALHQVHIEGGLNGTVGRWILERTIPDDGAISEACILFADYVEWCSIEAVNGLGQTPFGRDLTRRGFLPRRSGIVYRSGLRLKD